jgi:DNA-binding response OmpR family regulator
MNPEQAQAPGMTETTQHQILIVEDETTLAQGVRDALQYGGYNAQIATDGQQALDMIRREKPDLIVLDLMLPSLSGLEILATMRAEGLRSRVVILTALADEEDILRGFQAGADDYLTKPFSPRELVARVEAQFRRVIAADAQNAPSALRGIGIRIEDDILITADGHENLSAAIPKTIEDVEAACALVTQG